MPVYPGALRFTRLHINSPVCFHLCSGSLYVTLPVSSKNSSLGFPVSSTDIRILGLPWPSERTIVADLSRNFPTVIRSGEKYVRAKLLHACTFSEPLGIFWIVSDLVM